MGMTSFDKPLDHEIDELNSNIGTLNNIGIHRVYSEYSDSAKTHIYTAPAEQIVLVIVSGWTGNPDNSGMYSARLASSGGSITTIKSSTGATVTMSGRTLTVTVSTNWTSVDVYAIGGTVF